MYAVVKFGSGSDRAFKNDICPGGYSNGDVRSYRQYFGVLGSTIGKSSSPPPEWRVYRVVRQSPSRLESIPAPFSTPSLPTFRFVSRPRSIVVIRKRTFFFPLRTRAADGVLHCTVYGVCILSPVRFYAFSSVIAVRVIRAAGRAFLSVIRDR